MCREKRRRGVEGGKGERKYLVLAKSTASSRDVMGCRINTGALNFLVKRLDSRLLTATTLPRSPPSTTVTPSSLRSCSLRPLFCFLRAVDAVALPFAEPLAASIPATMVALRCFVNSVTAADVNCCRTHSFTRTKSGAYGERPLKAVRALTIALAAAATSESRSTRAMTRDEDASCAGELRVSREGIEVSGVERESTTMQRRRKSSGARVSIMPKVSWSRALGRMRRRRVERVEREFSSCLVC